MDEESVAADLIGQIGIGGNFVSEEHTVTHLRESYLFSDILRRDSWRDGMSPTALMERARAFVEKKTQGYRDIHPVVSEEKCRALDDILAAAAGELGNC